MTARRTRGVLSAIRPRPGEAGFTLVEVLITVVILGVIVGALSSGLIVALRTTEQTTTRLDESHDAQIVSAYLVNDTQSAATISATPCGSGSPLVTFQLAQADQRVSWYHEMVDGQGRVVRRTCAGAVDPQIVTVADFAGGAAVTCDDLVCDPVARPRPDVVALTVTEATGYVFTVKGSRRPYASDAEAATKALVQFGGIGGGSNKQLAISGKGTLHVLGNMYLDCCGQDPPQPATVISIEGQNATLDVDGTFAIFRYPSVGSCTGCVDGKVTSENPTPHQPESFNNHLSDPLASLAYPDVVGVKNLYGQTAPFTDGTYQGPGVYRSKPLTITRDVTDLRCRPDGICFDTAIYVLEAGISIEGNGTKVGGSNVLLFNGCGSNEWMGSCDNGSRQMNFSSNGGTIAIEPATTGPYANLLMFQHRSNTASISMNGGVSFTSMAGTIYAPNATQGVDLGSGNPGQKTRLRVKTVLATAMTISGNGDVVVG